jgi:hypothetical protein
MYGDPPDEPHLRVNTMWKRPERPDVEPDRIRRDLTRELWHRQAPRPKDLAPEEFHQWAVKRRIEINGRPVPKWARSGFLIDGVSHPAETYAVGEDRRLSRLPSDPDRKAPANPHRTGTQGEFYRNLEDATAGSAYSREVEGWALIQIRAEPAIPSGFRTHQEWSRSPVASPTPQA